MMLTTRDTYVLKGLALIMLLIHHLFWRNTDLYNEIHLYSHFSLFQSLGVISNSCVALFTFLSGYGLACKYRECNFVNKRALKDFYVHRYIKLYFNYWLVWILFVPISVVYLGLTLQAMYGDNIIIRLLFDIFGVSGLVNLPFYNTTWWYISCISGLYFVFPLV